MDLKGKHLYITTVILPVIGLVSSVILFALQGITLVEASLLLGFYVLGMLGVELSYHRYFTHKAFQTSPRFAYLLGVLGSLNFFGGVLGWAGSHRAHHKWTETKQDPHSPAQGYLHAWFGWFFTSGHLKTSSWKRLVRDLLKDPAVKKLHNQYVLWGVVGLLLPAIVTALVTWSWYGLLSGFIYCSLLKTFLVTHNVYLANTLGHSRFLGTRPYNTNDDSVNYGYLAIPTLGAAWHNNHHAQPGSALLNHRWYQIDIIGWFVYLLEAVGLIWNVNRPKQSQCGS